MSGLGVGPRAIATRNCDGVLCRILADMIDTLSDGCCEALESEAKSQADGYDHNVFVTVSFCIYCCLSFTWSSPFLDSLGELLAAVAAVFRACRVCAFVGRLLVTIQFWRYKVAWAV